MISPGELIQLVSPQGKKYLRTLEPEKELHTHDGKIELSKILEKKFWGHHKYPPWQDISHL